MDKIADFRTRACSNSQNPEYWFKLESDVKEFLISASEAEKKEWFDDWGCGEAIFMMCEYFRADKKNI